MMSRTPLVAMLLVGFVWASSCGRTGMDTPGRGTSKAPGLDGGSGGSGSGGTLAPGGGGFAASTSGAGGTSGSTGASSGPCGEATCLTSLFQTCQPAGSCTATGGGGPHTSVSTTCFANGVIVSWINGWDGVSSVRGSLTVRRNGANCYAIEWSQGNTVTSYVVTDASGHQVAVGAREPGATATTVTCEGGRPTSVSEACLSPISIDASKCDSGACP